MQVQKISSPAFEGRIRIIKDPEKFAKQFNEAYQNLPPEAKVVSGSTNLTLSMSTGTAVPLANTAALGSSVAAQGSVHTPSELIHSELLRLQPKKFLQQHPRPLLNQQKNIRYFQAGFSLPQADGLQNISDSGTRTILKKSPHKLYGFFKLFSDIVNRNSYNGGIFIFL